jgi:excisionase family DNA binding protein
MQRLNMPTDTEIPVLMTFKEVAALLRISDRHAAKLKADGKLPFVKIGSSVRFDRIDVLNLLQPGKAS